MEWVAEAYGVLKPNISFSSAQSIVHLYVAYLSQLLVIAQMPVWTVRL